MHESNNYFNDQILKKTVLYTICNKLLIICKLLLISMLQLKLSFLKLFKIKTQKFFSCWTSEVNLIVTKF